MQLDAKKKSNNDLKIRVALCHVAAPPPPTKASLSFLFDSEQVPAGARCSFTILWERRERVRKRKREEDCQKHCTISKWPVYSPQSFDSKAGRGAGQEKARRRAQ